MNIDILSLNESLVPMYVGFIVLSWSFSISKGYPVLRIDALYASPLHRNKGVGRKLMQYAFDLAIENKATRLQLETFSAVVSK
ncbi:GNAT family N-acetyltransferase [Paenibacillus sp. LMG 31460]|uniref:GNAT family N-acetyltransferase n=1 Tax=Paenibacillus germinis TaxID=2654979 RepID=A0ABX1ZFB8_9BACL|nr:GNAT family N-acetyltransferase [Paenibacillus germinis]NOU90586.1 GNAT family N-acetyltransferase [Paenibacillus germinis]